MGFVTLAVTLTVMLIASFAHVWPLIVICTKMHNHAEYMHIHMYVIPLHDTLYLHILYMYGDPRLLTMSATSISHIFEV